ncbi:hypothetical protein [Galactobacter sp.]|uniref:hypothetical protein n=1 Tax=Galactobacter sp. TaxID=2676125 RepID=UPI0025BBC0A0|nr:hypothetical protein [Galactobacter sp.]
MPRTRQRGVDRNEFKDLAVPDSAARQAQLTGHRLAGQAQQAGRAGPAPQAYDAAAYDT